MKIAIFPNYDKEGTKRLVELSFDVLNRFADCTVADGNSDENKIYSESDVVITIGGDGTLIKHAKAASVYGVPCLGINTGRLGFLANLEERDLDYLKDLKTGNFTVEKRMMLCVSAECDNKVKYEGVALNDVVISSGSVARLTDIRMNISGDDIDYRADGVIFSTPTGSTAYSLSAGGPIIDPKVRGILVTPICSHSLTARPILASEDSKISVVLQESSRTNAYLTVDGVNFGDITPQTLIKIGRANNDAKFINLTSSTIYKTLAYKF